MIQRARKQNKFICIEEEHAVALQYTVNGVNSQSSFATVHDEKSTHMCAVATQIIMLAIPQFMRP
jgi:hypothetical protein